MPSRRRLMSFRNADPSDVAANTAHAAGNGSDHADVAANTGARHTQNTDTKLDGGGANEITAAEAKAAHTHAAGDGSDHADVAANTGARHTQNTDTKLDEGGSDEVTAAEARAAANYITTPLSSAITPARRYILDSGKAIATYCPADGSVAPVSAGDRLYDGTTGQWLTAMETGSGSTMEWCGDLVSLDPDTATIATINATYSSFHAMPWLSGATAVWVIGEAMVLKTTAGSHNSTDRYTIQFVLFGVTGPDLYDTDGLTTDARMIWLDIDTVADLPAENADPGWYASQCRIRLEKNNAPDAMSAKFGGLKARYIYR